jgi:hypothetical protein
MADGVEVQEDARLVVLRPLHPVSIASARVYLSCHRWMAEGQLPPQAARLRSCHAWLVFRSRWMSPRGVQWSRDLMPVARDRTFG